MKYINKFSTNADYQAFTEGGGYVTPNVCYVEETDGIVMKPYIDEYINIFVESTNNIGYLTSEQSSIIIEYVVKFYNYDYDGFVDDNFKMKINGYIVKEININFLSDNEINLQMLCFDNDTLKVGVDMRGLQPYPVYFF